MNRAGYIVSASRMALVLFTVCVTMAVSCPQPGPEPELPVPGAEETKSKEYKSFENALAVGLYKQGECVLAYDENSFQESVNTLRRTYRFQSDDQTRYMNVVFSGTLPSTVEDECDCTISYSPAAEGGTILVVRLNVIKVTDDYLWLWNEFQKTGIVIPKI